MKTFKNITIKLFLFTLLLSGCQKLVELDPSANSIDPRAVFADSSSVQAAISGMYSGLSDIPTTSLVTYGGAITYFTSIYSGELTNASYPQYQESALTVAELGPAAIWSDSYADIYRANSIIEGVTASTTLTSTVRARAVGEAKFIRAFCHFYLVNVFGNIPLITSTDPTVNITKAQSSSSLVYQQIIADLKEAVDLLPASYSFSGNQRIRANKFVGIALLAKAYLYTGDWVNAEAQASLLINNTSTFSILDDQTTVFLANSLESIWQLDSKTRGAPFIASYFTPLNNTVQPQFIVSNSLLAVFESADTRRSNWIKTSAGLPYPAKYVSTTGAREYDVVFRLAEMYLIRAEARAHQNNFTGANDDLYVLRRRANLNRTTAADQPSMLLAVEKERQTELFCEWGNRFFDLKRTNKTSAPFFPIPAIEIGKNGNLDQNEAYK